MRHRPSRAGLGLHPAGTRPSTTAEERTIYLGPGQALLRPWLRGDPAAYLFRPKEAEAERLAQMRRKRKTRVQPSQVDRKKPVRKRKVADRYLVRASCHAIRRGCRKAFPRPEISKIKHKERTPEQKAELKEWDRGHAWHPHQLRHNAATWIRREGYGLDIQPGSSSAIAPRS